MMPTIMQNWLGLGGTRHDPRDGDPYVEALVRQLAQLRDNSTHRLSARRQG